MSVQARLEHARAKREQKEQKDRLLNLQKQADAMVNRRSKVVVELAEAAAKGDLNGSSSTRVVCCGVLWCGKCLLVDFGMPCCMGSSLDLVQR